MIRDLPIKFWSKMKKFYLLSIILFWFNNSDLYSQLLNPGFECETGSTITDWTNDGTGTVLVGTENVRTGANSLSYTTSSYNNQNMRANSTLPIPNNYYAYVIGWAKGDNSNAWASVGVTVGASESICARGSTGATWTRFFVLKQNTSGSTQNAVVKINSASGSGTSTVCWEDIVIYAYPSSTIDLTDPVPISTVTALSNAEGTSMTLNWTGGGDASSGVRGVAILRANGLSQTPPELNDQGKYSASGGCDGVNSIGNWAVVGIANEWVQTFTDNTISPNSDYTYAVYLRDGFFNYSTGKTSNATALPVELSSFCAYLQDNAVELQWQTQTEVNNYGFEIQRSQTSNVNSETWTKIGFVEGHGSSNSPKDYLFVDNDVLNGKYNYRLKQIDSDGKFEYSKAIEVIVGLLPSSFELLQNYPNPFNPTTTIGFGIMEKGNVKLSVYNLLGEEIRCFTQ